MWCHLLLAMPVLGLGLFLALPWPLALPPYLVIVALSLILYVKIWQSTRRPVRTGRGGMLGASVTVTVPVTAKGGQVRYRNELWSAMSQDHLDAGAQAHIVGIRGMQLVVQDPDDEQPEASDTVS